MADVRADGATVWTGTQKPHFAREGVAKITGLPVDSVRSIWVRGAGSYGRNDAGDAAMDAAYLSQAVGRPVRVQYMRDQGTGWDPKGPPSVHLCAAALDALAEAGEPDAIPALEGLAERFWDVAFIRFAVDAAVRRVRGR